MSVPAATRPEKVDDLDVQDVYDFLDDLRESCEVNMMAAPGILRDEYGCSRATSEQLFFWWTDDCE